MLRAIVTILALIAARPLLAEDADDDPVSENAAPRSQPANKKPAASKTAPTLGAAADPAAAESKDLPWFDSLARGYTQAQRTQKPVFVRAGSETCRFCRVLAVTITDPAVQEEFKRWTLVEIDIEKSPDDARLLVVGPIPALRLLTSTGRLVADAEGAKSAEDLVAWLQKHYDAAAVALPAELTDAAALDAAGVKQLIKMFRSRDAAIREAAIRRLIPHTELAALPVVEAFTEGSLAARLAALDLLREWKAPLEGLDPWRPETLTAARLKSLAEWGVSAERKGAANSPAEIAPQELADVRDMLVRMLAGTVPEAQAIRERLARYGRLLLPEVYERLKHVDADETRERLTALRYRLVESESLALNWPGGIERLAAADVETRRRAADELAARAVASDEGLLLELFSDPAPLVREISLRALMQTGASNINSALVRLLDDPEPNVRAAVLKQLAESPSQNLTARIAVYATQEKDPDLVVHAIRVLRESTSKTAIGALTSLLTHEVWQVRAEAAEGLGKLVNRNSKLAATEKADIYVTMVELLKDADGFVVSRAIGVLTQADLVAAVDPLAETAERHPELAPEVVQALSQGHNTSQRATVHLRRFAGHDNPRIRAAAISGLCVRGSDKLEEELKTALKDAESDVRVAAAAAFFSVLETQRHSSNGAVVAGQYLDTDAATADDDGNEAPGDGDILDPAMPVPEDDDAPAEAELPPPAPVPTPGAKPGKPAKPAPVNPLELLIKQAFGPGRPKTPTPPTPPPPRAIPTPARPVAAKENEDSGSVERDLAEGWLRAIRAGKALPKWERTMRSALEPLLVAKEIRERAAATLPLAALGADDVAVPEILRLIEIEPAQIAPLSAALAWLPVADRERVLEKMLARPATTADLETIADRLEGIRSPQAGVALWDLVRHSAADAGTAEVVKTSLLQYYFPSHYYQLDKAPARDRKRATADATTHARSGAGWQRVIGLTLLLSLESTTALEIARPMIEDETLSVDERTDALQIALVALPSAEQVPFAVTQLFSPHLEFRGKALASLTGDHAGLRALRGGAFELSAYHAYQVEEVNAITTGEPIEPEPPPGLEAGPLLPLLDSPDSKVAAQAGYLLALLGHAEGLPPLVAYWRARAANDPAWMRLVYRAIAKLDDGSQVATLKEIYARLNNDQHRRSLSEFYWTIRSMTGPEILGLRKAIRDEVGVQNLR